MAGQNRNEGSGGNRIWKVVCWAAFLYGMWELLENIVVRILQHFLKDSLSLRGSAVSIGIIGGADGPTAVFVTVPDWASWVFPMLLLSVGILGLTCMRKRK